MTELAQQLDQKLKTLDPARAKSLELLVRRTMEEFDRAAVDPETLGWPKGYFDKIPGALAGEEFERGDQGELPKRDDW